MPKSAYAKQISNAQVMLAGLRNNADQLGRRGISVDYLDRLDTNVNEAVALNNE
jgi:hypothetical protein